MRCGNVVDDQVQRRVLVAAAVRAQEGRRVIDADQTFGLGDGVKLLVGQVARVRADGVRVGMSGDQRRVAECGNVPETAFVQMRQVDQDAQPVAGGDQRLAEIGQTGACVGRRRNFLNGTPWPNAFGRLHTGPSEARSPGLACKTSSSSEIWINGFGAFDVQDHGRAPRRPGSARCRARCDETRTPPFDSRSMRNSSAAMAKTARCASARSSAGGSGSLAKCGDSVSAGGAFFRSGDGTKIANIPPAKPPARALGKSMWPLSSPSRKAATASPDARRCSRSNASLWPSKTGMRTEFTGNSPCAGAVASPYLTARRRNVLYFDRIAGKLNSDAGD